MIHYYKKIDKSYNITDGGEGQLGLTPSLETRKRISESNRRRKGIPFTDEHKRNISEGRKKRIIDSNGVIYNSIKDAAKQLGVARTSICNMLAGRSKSSCGLTFKFL